MGVDVAARVVVRALSRCAGTLALLRPDHAHARGSSRAANSASATPLVRRLARLRVTAGLGFELGGEVTGG
ncbi:hypothetical protein [Actinomadura sp. 6N118]|uniref:hypothetical protein n=1 Tax=Actinomadura sp. 6N118 TaxID=3375151 RepID=UPI0037988FE5